MQLLILFWEFFKIGLFSIGGGLATLPFLYALAEKYPWFDTSQIPDMIAISESTPGPMGVNMATYAGFQNSGIIGGVIATLGLVAPSIIIILIVSQFLEKFRKSHLVDSAFYGLRPIVVGLIASAGFGVVVLALFHTTALTDGSGMMNFFRWKECVLFLAILLISHKWKNSNPIFLILIGAVCGIVFHLG